MSMIRPDVECLVIGAGVIGLAVARQLARAGREVAIVEQERAHGTGVSSRSSEVIHAGLHYPQGSLKARFCVRGRNLLYAYCAQREVAHRRCGKLVVATRTSEIAALERIAACAASNGVDDLRPLSDVEAMALEPALRCVSAVLSPSTGIVDSHGLMASLLGEAQDAGAVLACGNRIEGGAVAAGGVELALAGGNQLAARVVINAAGLGASRIAQLLAGLAHDPLALGRFAKGNYFTLAGPAPFSRLVYPVPEPGGLGVHLTLDLAGHARFGPDVEWTERIDWAVDPRRAGRFETAIRRYWPALPGGLLVPAYAAIRPKIGTNGVADEDFRIDMAVAAGGGGLVNLLGFESPGLTSALAVAEHVEVLVRDLL